MSLPNTEHEVKGILDSVNDFLQAGVRLLAALTTLVERNTPEARRSGSE